MKNMKKKFITEENTGDDIMSKPGETAVNINFKKEHNFNRLYHKIYQYPN
jgi:hypothetical protein